MSPTCPPAPRCAPEFTDSSIRGVLSIRPAPIGYGGDALVSDATGLSRPTILKGRRELESGGAERGRIRRAGAGRPGIKQSQPGIKQALEKLVDPVTRGDPQSPLRWTCKSRAKLAAALSNAGWKVSTTTVGRLLHELGYRLQSVRKSREGTSHPDRDAQIRRPMSSCSVLSRWCLSIPRRRNWWGISRTLAGSGSRRGSPRNHWCTTFPRTRQARRFPTASMTWDATKHGSTSDVTTTRLRSLWRRCDGGGRRSIP